MYINNFGLDVLNKIAQNKYGKNFSDLQGDDLNNLKRRLNRFESFIKENNRMPSETEARKFGRADRTKTIFQTGGKEVTEDDVRNKLINEGKPAETFKKKVIFADKNIQNKFEVELRKRYSNPRTSGAAKSAGVLNNEQLYETFLKPAGYKPDSTRTIVDNYKKALFVQNLENHNVVINGYFEDYKMLSSALPELRTWFTQQEITNTKDVILHLRLQNRLIQISHNKNHIKADSFKSVLREFDYDRLHIVTDAEKWEPYTLEDIEKIRHEISIGPNPPANSPWVEPEQSLEYMNHLIEGFEELEPIVHCNNAKTIAGSGGLRGGFVEDFNLLRSFNHVIIFNSTFSWWAAALSGAQKVAVFSPWKIAKPKHQRRNLGETNYNGWFPWGSPADLYFKKYDIK